MQHKIVLSDKKGLLNKTKTLLVPLKYNFKLNQTGRHIFFTYMKTHC